MSQDRNTDPIVAGIMDLARNTMLEIGVISGVGIDAAARNALSLMSPSSTKPVPEGLVEPTARALQALVNDEEFALEVQGNCHVYTPLPKLKERTRQLAFTPPASSKEEDRSKVKRKPKSTGRQNDGRGAGARALQHARM